MTPLALMPRKPLGERPLTNAERVSRHHRQRKAAAQQAEVLRLAMQRVKLAKTLQAAHAVADEALTGTA